MWSYIFLFGSPPRRRPPEFTAILTFEFWREAIATPVPGLLCQYGRCRPENVSILSSLLTTNDPTSQGRYSSRYQIVFGWQLKFTSLTWENNAILFSSHCFTFRELRNSAINSEKDHNLKPLKTDIFLDDAFYLQPCLVLELASRPLRLVTYAITWGFWTNRSV